MRFRAYKSEMEHGFSLSTRSLTSEGVLELHSGVFTPLCLSREPATLEGGMLTLALETQNNSQAVKQHIKQTLEKTTRIIIKLNYKVFILLEQWNQECRQILGELAVVGIWSEIS